jgi:hypothetical protein
MSCCLFSLTLYHEAVFFVIFINMYSAITNTLRSFDDAAKEFETAVSKSQSKSIVNDPRIRTDSVILEIRPGAGMCVFWSIESDVGHTSHKPQLPRSTKSISKFMHVYEV